MPLSIGIDSELGAQTGCTNVDSPSACCATMPRALHPPTQSLIRRELVPVASTTASARSLPPSPLSASTCHLGASQISADCTLSAKCAAASAVGCRTHAAGSDSVQQRRIAHSVVDIASTAALDEHGQLILASHLYSPICTALTQPPLNSYHTAIAHLLCLLAALGFHMVGRLLVVGSMVAVCECVRCGRCGGGAVQYGRRLLWSVLFGWVALYA